MPEIGQIFCLFYTRVGENMQKSDRFQANALILPEIGRMWQCEHKFLPEIGQKYGNNLDQTFVLFLYFFKPISGKSSCSHYHICRNVQTTCQIGWNRQNCPSNLTEIGQISGGNGLFRWSTCHIVPNLLRLLYAMQPKQRNFSSFQHTVIPKGKFSCWRSVFYSAADQSILRGGYIYILSFAMAARLAFCGVLFWLVKIKRHLPRQRNQLNVNLGTFDDRMTSYCFLRLS